MKVADIVLLVSLIGVSGPVLAAYPLTTDDAGTVNLSGYELEAAYDNFNDGENTRTQTGGISFKHGITERMDIGVSLPCRVHPVVSERLGSASLGLKFSLVKDILAFSIANELGKKEYFLNAIYTKAFTAFRFHVNAGYLVTGDANERGTASYGLAAEYQMGKYSVVGELQQQEGGHGNVLLGLRYHLKEAFFISSGVARALEADRDRVTAGFHLEF